MSTNILFILISLTTSFERVKWCKLNNNFSCVEVNKNCPNKQEWSVVGNKINLLKQTNGHFTFYCNISSELFVDNYDKTTLLLFSTKIRNHILFLSLKKRLKERVTESRYILSQNLQTIVKQINCGDYTNCTSCTSDNNGLYCSTCSQGFFKNGKKCDPCYTGCASCNGYSSTTCFSCKENYYYDTSKKTCNYCPFPCSACYYPGVNGNCSKCYTSFYLHQYTCTRCSSPCNTCFDPGNNGSCESCISGYYLTENTCSLCNSTCETCYGSEYNQCNTCVSGKRYLSNGQCIECINCKSGSCKTDGCTECVSINYYRNGYNCFPCDSSCESCNGNSSLNCLSCSQGKYIDSNQCKTCDTHCSETKCLPKDGCIECTYGYFLENNTCHPCSDIPNCFNCSQTNKLCHECVGNFELLKGICVCKNGYYLSSPNICYMCSNVINNCKMCHGDANFKAICDSCYEPFVLNLSTKTCQKCGEKEYFLNKVCTINGDDCLERINKSMCLKCDIDNYLQNMSCESNLMDTNCITKGNVICENCNYGISLVDKCDISIDNCKYYYSTKLEERAKCLQCKDNTIIFQNNSCTDISNEKRLTRNNKYYTCKNGEYIDNNNNCQNCSIHSFEKCKLIKNTLNALFCVKNFIIDVINQNCFADENCIKISSNDCVECSKFFHYTIEHNKCKLNILNNCAKYNQNTCVICSEGFLLKEETCIKLSTLNCEKSNNYSCIQCFPSYVRNSNIKNTTCCVPTDKIIKYTTQSSEEVSTILECSDNYFLTKGGCILNSSTTTYHKTMKTKIGNVINNCEIQTTKGCLKCSNTYYLDLFSNDCLSCNYTTSKCLTCFNSTFCITCDTSVYFLNKNHICELASELAKRCTMMLPSQRGCVICNDGYYQDQNDCLRCDSTCSTCQEISKCLSCKENYYQILSESYLCKSYESLTNCVKKTSSGCLQCSNGYYLGKVIPRCYECSMNCLLCSSEETCLICDINFVLVDNHCKSVSEITFCLSAENSVCTKCGNNKKVSTDGTYCVDQINLKLVIALPVVLVLVTFVIFSVFIFVFYIMRVHRKEKNQMKNVCVFDMKKSNILFSKLTQNLVSNQPEIIFENEPIENKDSTDIPVDQETRALFCVGNVSKNKQKIQFSVKSGCDIYLIRTVPTLITLKRNEACEFEIFLKPYCSCQINDEILCISLDIKKGEQTTSPIKIKAKTILTTKLNNYELIESKKLGEGSFGIVYKGIFRGESVAIKRLKSGCDDDTSIKEFEKEVQMLDKFRSDYIVYFYGAVFIPNKICLVTEFAQYGSLKDLLHEYVLQDDYINTNKNLQSKKCVTKKLCEKFMLDMAKGIYYLHNNGVVHRDIKPDNLLIFSLYFSTQIIAKLTDFGSARNVNLLMTNMTFTNGIGTPKYMAPEVLNKEKYKMPSDIFSFAITMYEIFGWKEPYPKNEFKFAWSIANFVTNGNHLLKKGNITDDEFNIIEKCWYSQPEKRLTINEIVPKIEKIKDGHGDEGREYRPKDVLCGLGTSSRYKGRPPVYMVSFLLFSCPRHFLFIIETI
ncbi:protein serine/threonine kinase, putative [Entamoeba invadens IP1]|uniref:Protein serine/threonine kinase, putative n=1 Tax=Entamoeba invadens IP1 TaxID=370355 RepID=A0A0A1U358_ENTIV|nr:protein serine/threonine kinase, putative [Entamoeba invadens IP1]ELP85989.1 protein serine/threonine kinase, putative [Entamoeba invadens IP1]|eukprot:XP_004185335.1 protein serine/threonine kinase, putative [Entamoeba invadens IP1]